MFRIFTKSEPPAFITDIPNSNSLFPHAAKISGTASSSVEPSTIRAHFPPPF